MYNKCDWDGEMANAQYGLNYSGKFKQLEKFSLLEGTVNKRVEEIKIETTEKKQPSFFICPTSPPLSSLPVTLV